MKMGFSSAVSLGIIKNAMEDRKYVALDFDSTIYDTSALKKCSRQVFSSHGLEFDSIYRRLSKKGLFSFKKVRQLDLPEEVKKDIVTRCYADIAAGQKYLYPDAVEFIKSCHLPIMLFTFGETDYQTAKIMGSGVDKYIDKIQITQKSKHLSPGILKQIKVLADDSLPTLIDVKRIDNRIKLFLVDREDKYPDNKIPAGIHKIKRLTEIII
jgi:hypothetical protein